MVFTISSPKIDEKGNKESPKTVDLSPESRTLKSDFDRFVDIDLERGVAPEPIVIKAERTTLKTKDESLARIVEYIFIAILVAEIVSALALAFLFISVSHDLTQDDKLAAGFLLDPTTNDINIEIREIEQVSRVLDAIAIRVYIRKNLSNLLILVIPSCLIMITAWILTMIESRVNIRSVNIVLIMFGTLGYALVTLIAIKLIQLSFSIY